ncbi:hypothetical protein ABTE10_00795 [Acinetobacter baumannii]
MSDTVIRDFFVSLGFSTDNEGARKMGDALKGVDLKATLLHKTLLLLATGAVVAVAKTASELDKLYYSSQRIGASASNIRAYGDAISQMGGNAQNALQSLENVAQKMRNSPGYEGMLTGMGVATRDGNGQLRDRVEVMKDLSKTMKGMDYYQANAYASSLGIDENTLMAMRDDKFISNMEKYQKLRQDVGLNDELTKSGTEFMVQFSDITMTTKAITEVVVMTAGQALIPILKMINNFLRSAIAWFAELDPRFKAILATGLKFALLAVIFGGFIGTIAKLASVLPMLKGLLFLIKSLRLAFLASPIGIVLALAAAIAALWDDYQTWKNGGESLIDWSKWEGGIETAIARIKELAELIKNLKDKTVEFVTKAIDDPAGTAKETVAAVTEAAKTGAAVVANVAKSTVSTIKKNVSKSYGFSFGKDVDRYIHEAATKYGLDEKVLRGFVKMEDGWTGKMSPTGAIGTGQFIQSTWDSLAKTAEGKEIGMTKIGKRFRTKNDPRYDKHINTLATGLLAKQNADILTKNGLAVTGENLYLLHNIGPGIIPALKGSNKVSAKTLEAIRVNTPIKGQTPVQFVQYQKRRFKKHYNSANVSEKIINNGETKINNFGPPNDNPDKAQVNNSSNTSAKSVVIHQSYKTDMVINGAREPIESANAVKKQQENTMILMARNTKSLIG